MSITSSSREAFTVDVGGEQGGEKVVARRLAAAFGDHRLEVPVDVAGVGLAAGQVLRRGLALGPLGALVELEQLGQFRKGEAEQTQEDGRWQRDGEFIGEVAAAPVGEAVDQLVHLGG